MKVLNTRDIENSFLGYKICTCMVSDLGKIHLDRKRIVKGFRTASMEVTKVNGLTSSFEME